ncbi:MAG TPA: T9SS type A sorting domain-containing protein [Bacteroidia bacterium]|jgi:hypothetical protein|nr:T9SS type A sorting domain-containing protein [Bacteroidia bacterium]
MKKLKTMKKQFFISTILSLTLTVGHGQTIDLTTGGSGITTNVPQSFNESRGADVTVLSSPIVVSSMTLKRFCTGTSVDSGYVNAQLFDSNTHALLFSHDTIVHPMYNGTVSIPVSFTLAAGHSYRITFSCYGFGNNHNSGSGYMYQPTFPYYESNNLLRINQAWEGSVDSFPSNTNIFLPFISLGYGAASVNEFEKNLTLNIFPNPFFMQTTLQTDKVFKNASLTICNLQGQTVKQINNLSGHTIILHRDNLPIGLYFVRLTQDGKTFSFDKLIITDN